MNLGLNNKKLGKEFAKTGTRAKKKSVAETIKNSGVRINDTVATCLSLWAIADLAWEAGKKVYDFISSPPTEKTVSFCVDDGTEEQIALNAMSAVYLDKSEKTSAMFKLEKSSSKNAFKPAGDCSLMYKGKKISVEKKIPESGGPSARIYWVVNVHLDVLDDFLEEFDKFVEMAGNVSGGIYRWSGWSWRRVASVPEKRVVILPEGEMDRIVKDAKRFLCAKNWYEEKGIPWRRGYLFHGIAGSGKTSMAICLAISLGKSLYCISSKECSGSTFEEALRGLPRGAIVLIEDIDCIFNSSFDDRNKNVKQGAKTGSMASNDLVLQNGRTEVDDMLTLSDFLNAVDGVTSHKEGRILILTTNHKDLLDPAIIRKGRIDEEVEFKHADHYQLKLLSMRMLGEKEGMSFFNKKFNRMKTKITMAEAENILLPIALDQMQK